MEIYIRKGVFLLNGDLYKERGGGGGNMVNGATDHRMSISTLQVFVKSFDKISYVIPEPTAVFDWVPVNMVWSWQVISREVFLLQTFSHTSSNLGSAKISQDLIRCCE